MTTHGSRSPGLTGALEELQDDLGDLEQLFILQDETARRFLRRLEEDGEDMERLAAIAPRWQKEVDVFRTLRLDGLESFHSNFLAWLLCPGGNHGLDDYFLREFLAEFGAPRAVSAGARMGTTVRREQYLELDGESGRLDICILNEQARFLCAVENKVWSPESGSQLAFYRKALKALYSGYTIRLVFLTPRGDVPEDETERDHWITIDYSRISQILHRTIEEKGASVHQDVAATLRQYGITLRRNIVPEVSDDVHKLACKIYRKHKKAINLIIKHRDRYEPNYVTEGFRMVREAVSTHKEWREGRCNRPYARFVSADWDGYEVLKTDSWPYSLLLFQIHVTNHGADLSLFIAERGPEDLKKRIFDRVAADPWMFKGPLPGFSEGYIDLPFAGSILESSDYEHWWDEERIRQTISGRLEDFAQCQFPEVNRIVLDCLEEYRSVKAQSEDGEETEPSA